MRSFRILIILLSALGAVLPAKAANTPTVEHIREAARQYLDAFVSAQKSRQREVSYSLGSLDPRLQLADCGNGLEVEFVSDPEKSVRNTLLVSCSGDRPWRLFLNASIEISADAYVAATPLARGSRITAAMLRREKVIINQSRSSVYHDLAGLIGMEVRRPVREGTLLSPTVLTKPAAVARGDAVKIEAKSGPIVIETQGTALTDGKIGEQIAVENSRSGREIRGVIIGPGHVRVVM